MGRRGQANGGESEPPTRTQRPAETGGGSPWWVGSSNPIMLRVPRGLAVLAIVGLIGLMVLAYFVGYQRGGGGDQVAKHMGASELQGAGTLSQPPAGLTIGDENGTTNGGSGLAANSSTGTGGGQLTPTVDPDKWPSGTKRKPGLNYLRLALYPLDSAKQLQTFMSKRGLNTVLDKKGKDAYAVIAVNLGVKHIGSDRALAWKALCRQLGRAWGNHLKNDTENLASMYYVLYQPKP